jgi:hypothetical protein
MDCAHPARVTPVVFHAVLFVCITLRTTCASTKYWLGHALTYPICLPPKLGTTPWFGRIRGTLLSLLKQIAHPFPPARGHPGNLKQSPDFIAVTSVDAKHISDGEIMIRSLDYPNLIPGPDITLDDYSEVSPRSQRVGETAWEHRIVHPNAKPPTRYSWLRNLDNNGSDLPTLSDECIVHLNPFCRDILTELTVCERSADLLFPPPCVFNRVCVEHFIGSPVCLAIRLVVSGKIYASDWDPTDGR